MIQKRPSPLAIILVLGVVIGPLLINLPLWIAGWCLIFWIYAVMAHNGPWPWPGRFLRLLYTGTGFLTVLLFLGGGTFGGRVFVGLLCVMAGLKPLEIEDNRDRIISLFMAYFIIISSLFIIENLLITLYMFVSVLVTTACLIHLNHKQHKMASSIGLAGIIMLQALPLMILLFILFPRAEGTFFTLPGRYGGKTGFSESLQPGSISRLVRQDRTAFRVQFKGEIPSAEDLYWRGMVLDRFDGKTWFQGTAPGRYRKNIHGDLIHQYEVILEPHSKTHLFALDTPVSAPPLTRLTENYTLMSRWPIRKAYRYRVRSSPDAPIPILSRQTRFAQQLPEDGNRQARSLADTWQNQSISDSEILNQAIQYFKQGGFSYTLNPPLLGENPVDEFIFSSKSGYCEHFASAFAFLMRAANIPARVVVGYQGGEFNPYGSYIIVKQYHAHAWVEVLVDNKGWTRIDPTALVVPERVSMGLAESLLRDDLPDFLTEAGQGSLRAYFQKMAYLWDAINLNWNAWFMEYSRIEQVDLLLRFMTQISKSAMAWITTLCFIFGSLILVGWGRHRFRRKQKQYDPVKKAYDLFCKKLEGIGIQRKPDQGPVDFAQQAILACHASKADIEAIADTYIDLRYRANGEKRPHQPFVKMVKAFQPRSSA